MFVKRISNSSEVLTYKEIHKALTPTDYIICPKIPLSDVIDGSKLQLLTNDKNFLYGPAHFDFVICDSNHMPEFAVEFDGPVHQLYDEKKKKDIRKNRICALAKFRLIRVGDIELEEHDRVSLLSFMVDRFVKWKEEYSRIRDAIEQEVAKMPDSQLEQLTDGVLSPSIDPQFHFDITHRFPPTGKYREILETEYGILPWHSKVSGPNDLWCEVGIIPEGTRPEEGLYACTYAYGLYRGGENSKTLTWSQGHLTSPEVEVVYEGQVGFSMRWLLPTDERYDYSISPVEFLLEHDVNPKYFSEIPGAFIPSIADSFCEYLAYKHLIEWAQKNLGGVEFGGFSIREGF